MRIGRVKIEIQGVQVLYCLLYILFFLYVGYNVYVFFWYVQLKEDRRGVENEFVDNVELRGDKMCLELCYRRNNFRRIVLNGGYGVRKREINQELGYFAWYNFGGIKQFFQFNNYFFLFLVFEICILVNFCMKVYFICSIFMLFGMLVCFIVGISLFSLSLFNQIKIGEYRDG